MTIAIFVASIAHGQAKLIMDGWLHSEMASVPKAVTSHLTGLNVEQLGYAKPLLPSNGGAFAVIDYIGILFQNFDKFG